MRPSTPKRPARASSRQGQHRVRFIDKHRSYVINDNVGADLVRRYVESASSGDVTRCWTVFGDLLSSPRLPSGLQREEDVRERTIR